MVFADHRSRMRPTLSLCLPAVLLALTATPVLAQGRQGGPPAPPPSIEEKTAGMQKLDGFFPLYWDEAAGTLWMEIARLDTEVLYFEGLQAGLGSNDIGLDRGQGGDSMVVAFHRVGPKVLMVQPNYRFRASSDNQAERRAVEEAFSTSAHWGFTVGAETGGRVLVDLTDFLLRDTHNIAARLQPGTYRIDRSRSVVHMPRTKNFPQNTEIEVTLTFTSETAGGRGSGGGRGGGAFFEGVGSVAPSSSAVTLRTHHSIIELPGPGFEMRPYDPRSGAGGFTYLDYSTPLGQDMARRSTRRHRLEKRDPSAAMGEPVEPIVYYVDAGTPEPIRSALVEGASWWNQAFEAAGYRNGFQVRVMPEGADPMDVRYNVIQWVHRSTRGWSYGGSVTDPRTGEIIQGRVTLGSLRVRQDYLILESLLSPYENGTETPPELARVALARIRQLSAHETGHTLGFGHNYYDSTAGRISVMDYPHMLEVLRPDGSIDLSDAYEVGIGEWDKVMVDWTYRDLPAGTDEAAALRKILDDAWAKDLRYLSNQDMSVHPRVDQWVNGTDMAAELNRLLDLRRAALGRFGERSIKAGEPMALVEEKLVPLYLYHRYAVEAAASALGGQDYIYAMRGDGREPYRWEPAETQRAALEALMRSIGPAELVVPDTILKQIPPRPSGYGRHRELFPRYTGGAFDPIMPAVTAADLTVGFILQPDRAARLVAQHAVDPSLPGLDEVVDRLLGAGFNASAANPYEAEVARAIGRVVADNLMTLAGSAPMPQVRAIAAFKLEQLSGQLTSMAATPSNVAAAASAKLLAADIKRFLERPAAPATMPAAPEAPPGAPIGDPGPWYIPRSEPVCSWWR